MKTRSRFSVSWGISCKNTIEIEKMVPFAGYCLFLLLWESVIRGACLQMEKNVPDQKSAENFLLHI